LSPDNILWMGLRQVRDLRRTAIKTIITAQRQQPFTDLRDLLARGTEALKAPSPWQPVKVQGRWLNDAFGTTWLQVAQVNRIED
jgi:hypothetical protein